MIKKMKNKIGSMNNEDGMGTIEMIFLVAVLLSLAILFGVSMKGFVSARLNELTSDTTFDAVDPKLIKTTPSATPVTPPVTPTDGKAPKNNKISYDYNGFRSNVSIDLNKMTINFDSNTAYVILNQEA